MPLEVLDLFLSWVFCLRCRRSFFFRRRADDRRDCFLLMKYRSLLRFLSFPLSSESSVSAIASSNSIEPSQFDIPEPLLNRFDTVLIFKDEPDKIEDTKKAEILIKNGEILMGELPARVRSLVKEWTELYQIELQENWNLAREHEQLKRIPALE